MKQYSPRNSCLTVTVTPINNFRSGIRRAFVVSGLICIVLAKGVCAGDLSLAVYISPRLGVSSLEAIGEAVTELFSDPFKVTIHRNGKKLEGVIASCQNYIEQSDATLDAGTNQENQILQSMGVRCLALYKLATVKQAKKSLIPAQLDSMTVAQFPPQVAILVADDEIQRAEVAAARGQSLADFEKGVTVRAGRAKDTKVKPGRHDQLAVFGHGWLADLTIYARGDFDGDGFEDILLRRDGRVSVGTYGTSDLFVLTRTKSEGPLRVLEILPHS